MTQVNSVEVHTGTGSYLGFRNSFNPTSGITNSHIRPHHSHYMICGLLLQTE